MSINLTFTNDKQGIYAALEGKVTLKDFITGAAEAYSEENIQIQRYQIIDFTNCTSFELSSNDMQQIAKIDKEASETNPNIIIAIIATTDVAFGMSRVYEAYADETGFDIMVFRNSEDAEAWIQEKLKNNA